MSARHDSISDGPIDPRVILPRVARLLEHMEDWEQRSGATIEASDYAQRHSAEQTERTGGQVGAAVHRAREGAAAVESARHEGDHWREKCTEATQKVQQARTLAARCNAAANQAVGRWETNLRQAELRLSSAQGAERQATSERNSAAAAVHQAQAALQSARSALASARHRTEYAGTDSNGRSVYRPIDCSSYERAVASAERQLQACEAHLVHAQHRLDAAIRERQAAEERVAACRRALQLAQQAQTVAGECAAMAQRASAAAERAEEELARGVRLTGNAAAASQREGALVQTAEDRLVAARSHGDLAQASAIAAERSHSDARQRSSHGRMEIEWRMERLRAFDSPMPW